MFINLRRKDTGITDSDVFYDYLKKLGKIGNPAGQRITILPDQLPHTAHLPGRSVLPAIFYL